LTIKNTGTVDADSFDVSISYARDDGLGVGASSPYTVDGLAAGDSVQVTVNLSLADAGTYAFTAQVDVDDVVAESNEQDNTKTLSAIAVSLPNLAWGPDGFTVFPDLTGNGKYQFGMDIADTGTADVNDAFQVGFHYYVDPAGSGTLDPFDCCTDGPILAGSARSFGLGLSRGISLDPGHYVIYATLDSKGNIAETNEDDNEDQFTIDVP